MHVLLPVPVVLLNVLWFAELNDCDILHTRTVSKCTLLYELILQQSIPISVRVIEIVHVTILGHYATNRKIAGSIPDEVVVFLLFFFNLPDPSSRTMALGFTQPLTEMSTRNLPEGKGRPSRKADSLTALSEPNV
jgi:hypothetical protein